VLRKLYPNQIYVEIHPVDAYRLRISNGQLVWIESRRGQILATANLTASVRQGQVFIPMHYEVTNQLTLGHFDPHSGQPSYKDCAVCVRRADESSRHSPR
jgi:assimilatory nitrate reductase catalytic subunit